MNETPSDFGVTWLNEVLDDQAAYERFARFHEQLLNTVHGRISPKYWAKIAASDILQTSFRTFYRRVVANKIVVRDEDEAMAMIAAISRKKLLKKLKYWGAQQRNEDGFSIREVAQELDPKNIAPDERARFEEIVAAIRSKLPSEELYEVLDRVIEGYTSTEIREMMPEVSDYFVRLVRKKSRETLEEFLLKDFL